MIKLRSFWAVIIATIFLVSCAKRGNITGGFKDTIAPVLKESYPKNYLTEFKDQEFKLVFDEYIKLKDLNKQLVISPPMEVAPVISPTSASKYITVKIKDTLRENTTYSFNFGQSIQDNNEGNPYPQFKYIFSTGTYIDSLSISGSIGDALELKSDNFVNVMLYEMNETYNDSIIYKSKPRYTTNTLDSLTTFKIENIKAGKYLLVALKDANNNLMFNPQSDKIGYHSEPIEIKKDTTGFDLKLYKEKPTFKISKPSQVSGNKAYLGAVGDLDDIKIEVKNGSESMRTAFTKMKDSDSLQVWFPKAEADSLNLYVKKGSIEENFTFKYRDQKPDSLSFNMSHNGAINFRDVIALESTTPMQTIDLSKIQFINKDSLATEFATVLDTLNSKLTFKFKKEPLEKYTLNIYPGAITDFFGNKNDTLSYKFSTKSESEYGNMRILLSQVKSFPIIVQLIDDKGKVLAEEYSEENPTIEFLALQPNKFRLRIIYDTNKNGVWDPGNFLNKTQSEEVIYFPEELDVRANWEVEQPFILAP